LKGAPRMGCLANSSWAFLILRVSGSSMYLMRATRVPLRRGTLRGTHRAGREVLNRSESGAAYTGNLLKVACGPDLGALAGKKGASETGLP
jgi:hypothetical protein